MEVKETVWGKCRRERFLAETSLVREEEEEDAEEEFFGSSAQAMAPEDPFPERWGSLSFREGDEGLSQAALKVVSKRTRWGGKYMNRVNSQSEVRSWKKRKKERRLDLERVLRGRKEEERKEKEARRGHGKEEGKGLTWKWSLGLKSYGSRLEASENKIPIS